MTAALSFPFIWTEDTTNLYSKRGGETMINNLSKSQKMGHSLMVNFVVWAYAFLAIMVGATNIYNAIGNRYAYMPLITIVSVLMIAAAAFTIKVRFEIKEFRPEAPGRIFVTYLILGVLFLAITGLQYISGERLMGSGYSTAFVFFCSGLGFYRFYSEVVYPVINRNASEPGVI